MSSARRRCRLRMLRQSRREKANRLSEFLVQGLLSRPIPLLSRLLKRAPLQRETCNIGYGKPTRDVGLGASLRARRLASSRLLQPLGVLQTGTGDTGVTGDARNPRNDAWAVGQWWCTLESQNGSGLVRGYWSDFSCAHDPLLAANASPPARQAGRPKTAVGN